MRSAANNNHPHHPTLPTGLTFVRRAAATLLIQFATAALAEIISVRFGPSSVLIEPLAILLFVIGAMAAVAGWYWATQPYFESNRLAFWPRATVTAAEFIGAHVLVLLTV